MTRVLLVSYHFPPSAAVGALRPGRLARLLPEFGFSVDVICGPAASAELGADPTRLHLVPDAADVRRVAPRFVMGRDPGTPSADRSVPAGVWWKTRAYLEWLAWTRDWSWRWGVDAAGVLREIGDRKGIDLVLADGPPFPPLAPVLEMAETLSLPVVLDLRDLWWIPEERGGLFWFLSPPHRRGRWGAKLRDRVVRGAEHLVLTTPEMAEAMRRRFPDVDPSRFSCIPNAYSRIDEEEDLPRLPDAGRLKIVYTGSLAYGRLEQARQLIQTMGLLRRRGLPEVEVVFVGGDSQILDPLASECGLGGLVSTLGWMEEREAVRLQREAHALLLLQPPDRVETRMAIPGKLFDYMARRRNILALAGPGPVTRMMQEHDLGVTCLSSDPESMAKGVGDLRERVARRPVLPPPPEEFSERTTVRTFANTLTRVLGH